MSVPGHVVQVDGPRALLAIDDREIWCNALAQPDVQVGDFVLVQADLIIAIINEAEADEIMQTLREMQSLLDEEDEGVDGANLIVDR